jgi:hypothetical protein
MATGFDGKTPPSLLPAIGSYCPIIPFSETPANATSQTITFAQLKNIRGWIIQFSDSNGAILGGDSNGALGPIVSADGNVLTIADGTDLDISAHTSGVIYGFVWGDART